MIYLNRELVMPDGCTTGCGPMIAPCQRRLRGLSQCQRLVGRTLPVTSSKETTN